jgi:hypothetical protein
MVANRRESLFICDDEGVPLVTYHGTAAEFDDFAPERAGQNYAKGGMRGIFFSADPHAASTYAIEHAGASPGRPAIPGLFKGSPAEMGSGKANVVPAYLRMNKPLVRKVRGYASPDIWFDRNQKAIYAAVDKAAADGVIVQGGEGWEDRTLYVVFSSDQVVFKCLGPLPVSQPVRLSA